jgi:hypothetical protein
MEATNKIDLDKIAEDGAKTTVATISVAENMGLINDQQDLQLLIQAGIRETLDQVLLQLNLDK